MMNAFLLVAAVCAIALQNVLKKAFGLRVKDGVFSFGAISVAAALLVFIVTSGGTLFFSLSLFGYSFAFAVTYCTAVVFSVKALSCGPVSLTALIAQYSLLLPTFYGILFLFEAADLMLAFGLAFLCVSLLLTNLTGKKEKRPSWRWGLYASLSFLGNGLCSTVQKAQQVAFRGAYKSDFMIFALIMTLGFLVTLALIYERKTVKTVLRKGSVYGVCCGLSNGILNLCVLNLAARMNASLMFPVMAAGGVAATSFVAVTLYRERLTVRQWIGVSLGVVAIVFLNI